MSCGNRFTRTAFRLLLLQLCFSAGLTFAQDDDQSPATQQNIPTPEPTVVAYREYQDPLIRFNRAMFRFNDVSYRHVLIPLANGYNRHVPEPVRDSVGNFYYNLKAPIHLINNLLQGHPGDAGNTLLRFGINTTVGLLGLFDPATAWFELPRTDTGFEDTLVQYGAGYGVYLVLPLLGSSDLRSGTGSIADMLLHPAGYLLDDRERIIVQGFGEFQEYAPAAPRYLELTAEVEDPYIFLRNMYLQGILRDADYADDGSTDAAEAQDNR